MSEIDVVVDVRQSQETGELIVSKQKVAFNGDARLVGPPVESRVGARFNPPPVVFHRRAVPLFDTLPEVDREAILKTVAPLRTLERVEWASVGAHPLENNPLAFLLRVGEDVGVVVTQTEDKKVEIVDVVRESVLQQVLPGSEGSAE